MMGRQSILSRAAALRHAAGRRSRDQSGYTLIELLVVMSILAMVMGPLVGSFASGMHHEVDQVRREQAYANARLAVQRMRVDIHCSTGFTSFDKNAYGGFTLTLAETNDQPPAAGWCPAVIPAGSSSSGVQWCTIPYPGSTTRFRLFRYLEGAATCDGGVGSTFEVDYLAATPGVWPTNSKVSPTPSSWVGNIWPTPATCASGSLPTVAVDLNVAVDPVKYPKEHYELRDEIALRNAARC
jgi:prepilin-type N-terminal cleavage/methylation domain-containing protein